jgi:hypothetical protein
VGSAARHRLVWAASSGALVVVAAAMLAGAIMIIAGCHAGRRWESTTAALLAGSGAAVGLAVFLPLQRRPAPALATALLVAAAYAWVAWAAIDEAGVGDECFH